MEEIEIDVDFYDKKEKKLFQNYSNKEEINSLVETPLKVPKGEFLTYMLFNQKDGSEGYKTFEDMKAKVNGGLGHYYDFIDVYGEKLVAKKSSKALKNAGYTEQLGISLGLNTINNLHGLNEADWEQTDDVFIDGKRQKDFDYELNLGSDGQKFILVENKGVVCDDNRFKNSKVSSKKRDIKKKKKSVRGTDKPNLKDPNIYYGTIAVIDKTRKPRVLLVDPPEFFVNWSPYKYKVISRLLFYKRVFTECNVQPRLIKLLEKRIEVLKEANEIESYDSVRLISQKEKLRRFVRKNRFISLGKNLAFGQTFEINPNHRKSRFICMVTKEAIKMIVDQDFEKILNYRFELESERNALRLSFGHKTFKAEFITKSKIEIINLDFKKSPREMFIGNLYTTSTGRIFGELSPKD